MPTSLVFFILIATAGSVLLAAGFYERLFAGNSASQYLASLDDSDEIENDFVRKLHEPLLARSLGSLRGITTPLLRRVTPAGLLEKARRDLMLAGIRVAPEELLTLQAALGALGLLGGIAFVSTSGKPGLALLALIFLPGAGLLAPSAIVKRKGAERAESIFKDLPDCLDLLAISVEAGVGFEAALDVVCNHFDSALAEEFRLTLREMELGLSRREAMQNLRARNEVPELSNFILALTQADALGMPIGRVLHTQATELRNRRRQWAREKAAKLPVKIMFPLVLFIFPSILVVVLFPAAGSILKALS